MAMPGGAGYPARHPRTDRSGAAGRGRTGGNGETTTLHHGISVIVPAYNRAASVGRALASIGGGFEGDHEIIVVDDGSTDGTGAEAQAAIARLGVGRGRVLHQANAGPGAARNTGAAVARGAYLAFLDSDDLWFPDTLATLVAALEDEGRNGRAPALVFLQTVDLSEAHLPTPRPECGLERRVFAGVLEAVEAAPGTRYGSGNVVIRHDVYDSLGGFTEAARCSEDTDLFLRAAASGPCMVLTGRPLVMVVHAAGAGGRLTGRVGPVLEGLRFLRAQDRAGRYPEAPTASGLRDRMLAKCASHTIRMAHAAGHAGIAYRLYLENLPRLWRARNWHWLIRLPLLPLLSRLRPASYGSEFTRQLGHRPRGTPVAGRDGND